MTLIERIKASCFQLGRFEMRVTVASEYIDDDGLAQLHKLVLYENRGSNWVLTEWVLSGWLENRVACFDHLTHPVLYITAKKRTKHSAVYLDTNQIDWEWTTGWFRKYFLHIMILKNYIPLLEIIYMKTVFFCCVLFWL